MWCVTILSTTSFISNRSWILFRQCGSDCLHINNKPRKTSLVAQGIHRPLDFDTSLYSNPHTLAKEFESLQPQNHTTSIILSHFLLGYTSFSDFTALVSTYSLHIWPDHALQCTIEGKKVTISNFVSRF